MQERVTLGWLYRGDRWSSRSAARLRSWLERDKEPVPWGSVWDAAIPSGAAEKQVTDVVFVKESRYPRWTA